MLRRLVSSNTVEFKKPPAAPEPAAPDTGAERAEAASSSPREDGSALRDTNGRGASEAEANGVQGKSDDQHNKEFRNRTVTADASYAKFSSDKHTELKMQVHQQLLDTMNLTVLDKMTEEQIRSEVGDLVRELLVENNVPLTLQEQQSLIADILDEVLGLGPIEPLLKDPTISDILVNTYDTVVVERFGRLEMTPVKFKDNRHLLRIIDKIVSAIGRRIDEGSPMVDARLLDGSRVNAVIAPVAVDGPLLSIRRFAQDPYTMDRLIDIGTLTPNIAELLEGIVRSRKNILISGGTGSGKTTMLNAMASYIDPKERIITIEDAAELQLQQPQVARMETRPPNVEGKGEIAQRELVKNSLRMRPDRIIVGEVRGGEAFDMLQAMNTGHEGSMTTVHANMPRDALSRIENMIGMAQLDLPQNAMRAQIASAIHVVIQLSRLSDGRRRLISVQEVTGMEGEVITMQEIFRFDRRSTDADGTIHGAYVATGIRPKFIQDFNQRGIYISDDLFEPNQEL